MAEYTYYSLEDLKDMEDYWVDIVGVNVSDDRHMIPYATKTTVSAYGTFLSGMSCALHITILVAISRLITGGSSGLDSKLLSLFSCCQLFSVIFVVPFEIIREYYGRWYLGAAFCKIWMTYSHLFIPVMLWTLVAIAIDRIYDLRCMRVYKYSKEKICMINLMIFTIFTLSFIGLIPLQLWMHSKPEFVLLEVCAVIVDKAYTLILASLFYFIPASVLICCLIALVLHARSRITQLGRAERQESLTALDSQPKCLVYEHQSRTSQDVDTFIADLKNSCLCLWVTSIICIAMWAPVYISNVWLSHGKCNTSFCLDPKLWALFQWIGYTSSLICPCTLFIDKRLRATIRYWLRLDINHGDFVYRRNRSKHSDSSDVNTSVV